MKDKLRIFYIFIISIFIVFGCNKTVASNDITQLYRIRIDGKWGFIDYDGNIVIPCIYKTETDFVDGIAFVNDGHESYYINGNGKKIFSNKKMNYISDVYIESANEHLSPEFIPNGFVLSCDNAYIGENMFTITKKNDDELVGVMNVNGKIIVEPKFFDIGNFKYGMAPFKYGHNGIDGYIRRDGKIFDYLNL